MSLGDAAKVLAAGVAWRATAGRAAGATLVRALGHGDENVRTIAGMLLVRGGPRAAPLVRHAVERGEGLPVSLGVLGNLGGPGDAALLERYTRHPDERMSLAARAALESLADRTRALGRDAGPPRGA
jgi:hypothetical protein